MMPDSSGPFHGGRGSGPTALPPLADPGEDPVQHPPSPPPPPGGTHPHGARSYVREYELRLVTGYTLIGVMSTFQLANFAAVVVAAETQDLFGLLRGMAWAPYAPAWADAIGVLTLVAVPPLVCVFLVWLLNLWPAPDRLPPWTTPEHLRAARVLHRHGRLGGDPRTAMVARSLSEALLVHADLITPRFRFAFTAVTIACSAFMVAVGLYLTVRYLGQDDLNGLASGASALALFVGFLCLVPLPIATRSRARRYRDLYDAAHRGPLRRGAPR